MTVREKMLAGELYDCGDEELLTRWHKAKERIFGLRHRSLLITPNVQIYTAFHPTNAIDRHWRRKRCHQGYSGQYDRIWQSVSGGTEERAAGLVDDKIYLEWRKHMEIYLSRAGVDDAKELHAMQVAAFKELLEKYQDYDTSPGSESVEKVEARLKQDFTYYYFICIGQQKAGAVRIVDSKETGKNKRISPIFVLPEFQGKGIAQEAIRLCEEAHGNGKWELDTILQEPKNCHLYEKMGYRQTGKTEVVNDRLTLVFYEK